MKEGDNYIVWLPTPEADYCAVLSEKEFTPIIKLKLMPISIPGNLLYDKIALDKDTIEALKRKEESIVENAPG